MGEKNEEKKKEEIITTIYKVHLHCGKCACDLKRPLLRTQGVHSVEVDVDKNEIRVQGIIQAVKIHKQIEKWSKKKVGLISSKPFKVVKKTTTKIKKEVIRTTVLKVHIHCAKCDKDLHNKLLKHKAIHIVKTDTKAQTLTVHRTIESVKLLTYIRKKVHKHAELVSSKTEEEKKKKEEEEKKKKGEVKVEVTKKTSVVEVIKLKEKVKVEGKKDKDGNVPYFVHYVYAPQLFSDENPKGFQPKPP